ncbi:MAG TPA: FAD:protein FMN transferase [Solirubrobacteraceae bacterium]|nr:FAD:protein FMN transferase [Solirubrobacteraceae bacterium]
MSEITFDSMGSTIRIVAEAPLAHGAEPTAALAGARAWTEDFAWRLSRFVADSELSRLNADPRAVVPASPLLRAAVGAATWAAQRTDGLIDPTLVGALEAAGYRDSRVGVAAAPLADALASAPERRPAHPRPDRAWRAVRVLGDAIERPPGVRLDSGGTGKGLAADALLVQLAGFGRVAVDCGGDVRIGGPLAASRPFQVDVQHPLTGDIVISMELGGGGIATSGLDRNVWQRADGSFAHHLLDPSTGEPAWTGLVGATALAPSALEAETLAKAALLSGPERGRALLAEHGGVLFTEDGGFEAVGVLARAEAVAA